jgi:hypothetical protein
VTHRLLAEYESPAALLAALARVRGSGGRAVDACTPYPVEGLAAALGEAPPMVRGPMAAAVVLLAALAYAVQWYSAVIGYPLNAGGRPLDSWPVFLLVPIEVALFGASLTGLVALFTAGGMPRLHQPLFGVPAFERASRDRFFLLAEHDQPSALRAVLEDTGALSVTQVRP